MQKQKRKIKKNIAKGRVGKVRGKSARVESEQGSVHEEERRGEHVGWHFNN